MVIDVTKAERVMLTKPVSKWLINHIQHDDADYVGAVKENMMGIIKEKEKKRKKAKTRSPVSSHKKE